MMYMTETIATDPLHFQCSSQETL